MPHVRRVFSALVTLVRPGALMCFSAGAFLASVPVWDADPDHRGGRLASGRVEISDDGTVVRLTPRVPRGEVAVPLVIQDADRNELAALVLHGDGLFTFESHGTEPVLFTAARFPSRSISLG